MRPSLVDFRRTKEPDMVQDVCTYHVEVKGRVDERDVNVRSPSQVTVLRGDDAATLLTVRTDQAGLIGLLRHLHGRGDVLLSVVRER
jgi:hypothetical protein